MVEALRQRFMAPRLHLIPPDTQTTRDEASPPGPTSPPRIENESTSTSSQRIAIRLSESQTLALQDNSVILYDPQESEPILLSTPENPHLKIKALETLAEKLVREERMELEQSKEVPIVWCILESFACKDECFSLIDRLISEDEIHRIIIEWVIGVWENGRNVIEIDDDGDTSDGSLFSDADVETKSNPRVRPITLRSSTAPPKTIKQEIKPRPPTPQRTKSESEFKNQSSQRSLNLRKPSPEPHLPSPKSASQLRSPGSQPPPSNTIKSESFRPKVNRKRTLPFNENSNSLSKPPRHKRIRSAEEMGKTNREPKTLEASSTNRVVRRVSEQSPKKKGSVITVFEKIEQQSNCRADEEAYIMAFWKQTIAEFPESVRMGTVIDRVGHFFHEVELLRKENEQIKREEAERRGTMLLIAEKIMLLNQGVQR